MPGLMQNLCYAVAFASLLLGLHMLAARPANPIPTRILGASFLLVAAQGILLALALAGGPRIVFIARPTLAMLLGPLFYFYFASVSDPAFRFRAMHALHFVPALVIGAEMTTRVRLINVDYAIFASFFAYAAILWRFALRGPAGFAHLGAAQRDAFVWLLVCALVLTLAFLSETIIYFELRAGGELATSKTLVTMLFFNLTVVGLAVFSALRRPSPFDWMYALSAAARRGSGGPTMSEEERAACIAAFEKLVAVERPHLEENVTLADAARRLGVPARRLSQAINYVYGESFSRRMNRLRVEEAQRLLKIEPACSMTDVMFNAGFRTKSSFNREFRAIAGISPSEFRDSHRSSRLRRTP